ncbi:SpoVR family protein [Anaeromyxobacter paludicola]|uniref:SpoVR family protein n=1 Tax=Anaeromyxobacter paludicola TaxID=2918171 RepID=UPI00384E4392
MHDIRVQVERYAREYGLDFFETVFEVLGFDEINMVAAYGGFPNRYPHWRFGMEYDRLSKGYEYGLSKIYEMVINNDPSYAYLLESNMDVDQKLVMAHVYGHVDFFKNNFMFRHTNRKMMDQMANHATRVRRYQDRLGVEKVEEFIDRGLSLENLIDYQSPYVKRRAERGDRADEPQLARGLKTDREYMQDYINPPEFLEEQQRRLDEAAQRARKVPERPERDVLLFLLEHAPLEDWERDVLAILRDEAYYFAPQGQTKIMNEGWATYWHSTIMTQKALTAAELIDYADHHSGTLATSPGQLNPYKLGVELWRDIEDRWNKGRFGKDYEDCDSYEERRGWDRKLGLGREKIFEVRKHYNDVTFIDEFLTLEFCLAQRLFTYGYSEKHQRWEVLERDFKKVKEKLLHMLTNFGQPTIAVEDGNFENRGELLLIHKHDGVDLKLDYARDTLAHVERIWRRPVNLVTRVDGRGTLMRFDGREHSDRKIEL